MSSITRRSYLLGAGSLTFFILLLWGSKNTSSTRFTFGTPVPHTYKDNILDDINNQTLGFQKIFVISLPSRTDHRDAVSLAAALTGLQFEFVDGVTEVPERALPAGGAELGLDKGELGNWRAHMSLAQKMVKEGISSALVLEDDADWDIRIKLKMQDFAKASRLLIQPLRGTSDAYLDPTHPEPQPGQQPSSFVVGENDPTVEPSTSPYGDLDRWDLFWIGHCGCRFPDANDRNVPIGRAVIANDTTVPEPQHVKMQFGDRQLVDQYPAHTRVVSRTRFAVCTVGYGLSQNGARRLLYEFGVNRFTGTTDTMLREVCDGTDGRRLMTCFSVQPQLFQHHRAVGPTSAYSDITEHKDGYNSKAFTRNVRWSTRMNLQKLIDGQSDYIDLFKDGEQAADLGWR